MEWVVVFGVMLVGFFGMGLLGAVAGGTVRMMRHRRRKRQEGGQSAGGSEQQKQRKTAENSTTTTTTSSFDAEPQPQATKAALQFPSKTANHQVTRTESDSHNNNPPPPPPPAPPLPPNLLSASSRSRNDRFKKLPVLVRPTTNGPPRLPFPYHERTQTEQVRPMMNQYCQQQQQGHRTLLKPTASLKQQQQRQQQRQSAPLPSTFILEQQQEQSGYRISFDPIHQQQHQQQKLSFRQSDSPPPSRQTSLRTLNPNPPTTILLPPKLIDLYRKTGPPPTLVVDNSGNYEPTNQAESANLPIAASLAYPPTNSPSETSGIPGAAQDMTDYRIVENEVGEMVNLKLCSAWLPINLQQQRRTAG